MFVNVAMVPGEARRWRGMVCIVVDVLRASSSITTALDRGCRAVIPVPSVAEARRMAQAHGYLAAGERDGIQPRGFDFDNSPTQLSRAELRGKTLVLATTNGTVVLRRLRHAPAVLIGCMLNATAVCEQALMLARRLDAGLGVVCAGRGGYFVLDDAVTAGVLVHTIVRRLESSGESWTLGDGARAAGRLSTSYPEMLVPFQESGSGRRIAEVGLEADLRYCLQPDLTRVVPVLVAGTPPHLEPLA